MLEGGGHCDRPVRHPGSQASVDGPLVASPLFPARFRLAKFPPTEPPTEPLLGLPSVRLGAGDRPGRLHAIRGALVIDSALPPIAPQAGAKVAVLP